MPIPVPIAIGATILGWYYIDRLIKKMGGTPEEDVTAELGREQFLASTAQMGPAHEQMTEEALGREYEFPTGRMAARTAQVRAGTMDEQLIPGGVQTGLLTTTAAKLGMSPEQLARRVDPRQGGDYSSLSRASFGRRPKSTER
jgi:hypothetical protein